MISSQILSKIINIILIFLFMIAVGISPVSASEIKILSDSPNREIVVNDFYTQLVNFNLNDKWSDKTLLQYLRYCGLDDSCWDKLTPNIKERFDKSFKNTALSVSYKLDPKKGLIPLKTPDKLYKDNFDRIKTKVTNQGWNDNNTFNHGALKISYKNNLNNDNKFVVKIKYTPKNIYTYNHKFQIYPNDQKEIIAVDKTYDLNTDLSHNDRYFIELITKIVDKHATIDDITLVIEGGVLLGSVVSTVITCGGIPITLGTSSVPCYISIASTTFSGGLFVKDISKNAEIKDNIAKYIKDLDFYTIEMGDGL